MGGRVYAGGRVYTGAGRLRQADILVEGGIIRRIAPRIVGEGQERVDCAGLILAPGFIDLHAHLREPGFEEKETIASGTALAKRSGFQTVCAMPNLNPAPDAPETARVELEAIARGARVVPGANWRISKASRPWCAAIATMGAACRMTR